MIYLTITKSSLIGKPTGIDIREQKNDFTSNLYTPIKLALTKNKIINTVKNHHHDDKKVSNTIN